MTLTGDATPTSPVVENAAPPRAPRVEPATTQKKGGDLDKILQRTQDKLDHVNDALDALDKSPQLLDLGAQQASDLRASIAADQKTLDVVADKMVEVPTAAKAKKLLKQVGALREQNYDDVVDALDSLRAVTDQTALLDQTCALACPTLVPELTAVEAKVSGAEDLALGLSAASTKDQRKALEESLADVTADWEAIVKKLPQAVSDQAKALADAQQAAVDAATQSAIDPGTIPGTLPDTLPSPGALPSLPTLPVPSAGPSKNAGGHGGATSTSPSGAPTISTGGQGGAGVS